MTKQDIFNHFRGYTITRLAEIFDCSRDMVYKWGEKEQVVPEVVSLRADFMTDGELAHDPGLYGADYKRGEYKQAEKQPTENRKAS